MLSSEVREAELFVYFLWKDKSMEWEEQGAIIVKDEGNGT